VVEGPERQESVIEEPPESREAWQAEVLLLLRVLVAGQKELTEALVRLAGRSQLPDSQQPAAASKELPGEEEPLGTWILTDQRVHGLEAAIEQEQRVRGQAYGG
jgi:hypothetical protein